MSTVLQIDEKLIKKIRKNLNEEKLISEDLPNNGIIYIDKVLPFLCIIRYDDPDYYFFRLAKTQSSYLIVHKEVDVTELLETIRETLSKKYEMLLLMEIWQSVEDNATFKINCPEQVTPETAATLQKGFEKLRLLYPNVSVNIDKQNRIHPHYAKTLFDKETARKKGIVVTGVSIPTLYKNKTSGELYSLFFREFYTNFSETVKRTAYEFIRVQTSDDYQNYLMLGQTHIDEITRKADEELAEISDGISFLLRATPINSNEEWKKFRENKFKKTPNFVYRLIALDPEIQKRKLYNIPIDKVEDPTIAFILRGKRLEIEKQLTMLEERGTNNFRFVGKSLYGVTNKRVLKEARKILKKFPKRVENKKNKRYSSAEFAEKAKDELEYYNSKFPEMELTCEIRNDVAGIMVSKSKLLINNEISFDRNRFDALIQHEVATHILTYCNGKQQPLHQMYEGFEGYDQLQEGIAVLAEYLVGGLTVNRLRLLAGRVIAVESMVNSATFIETFNKLRNRYGFSDRISYYITMRVYRGGGLTKDAVYLAGLIDVLDYIKKGGNINNLYVGKFNTNHIPLIEELLYRKVLKKAVLPRFLERNEVKKRLKKLKKGIELIELVN